MDLSKSNEIWGDIIKVKRQAIDRPELLISLNYLPQAARLTLVVIRAKNLENDELFARVCGSLTLPNQYIHKLITA